jgi:hypothetical protein
VYIGVPNKIVIAFNLEAKSAGVVRSMNFKDYEIIREFYLRNFDHKVKVVFIEGLKILSSSRISWHLFLSNITFILTKAGSLNYVMLLPLLKKAKVQEVEYVP